MEKRSNLFSKVTRQWNMGLFEDKYIYISSIETGDFPLPS